MRNYIVPTMDDWDVFIHEAVAVGMKAIEQGVAMKTMSREELIPDIRENNQGSPRYYRCSNAIRDDTTTAEGCLT